MANFSIQDLERLAAMGQGGGESTSYDHPGDITFYEALPQPRNIRADIYKVVLDAERWMSRGEIGKALKLKRSNWLNAHIDALVDLGYLRREVGTWHNGMTVYWYAVAPRMDGE